MFQSVSPPLAGVPPSAGDLSRALSSLHKKTEEQSAFVLSHATNATSSLKESLQISIEGMETRLKGHLTAIESNRSKEIERLRELVDQQRSALEAKTEAFSRQARCLLIHLC